MKILGALFFLSSVAGAWYTGTRMRTQDEEPPHKNLLPRDYLTGLNFLLNDETDKAVDIFVKMLEVDSETVETHLAVGKLFRKRGEVDRAIRIHQNLIARPQLDKIYREQSLFELGQDYLSAGMLDRAERVFLELIQAKSHSARALQMLIDIYQQEKDWENAIKVANQYETVTRQNMQAVIAHYYCELADIAYLKEDFDLAREQLSHAFAADPSCVRASLLQAKVCIGEEDYKSAIRFLKKIKDQNPDYLSEAIDMLACCYEKNQQKEELLAYLNELVEEHPNVPIVLILAEKIRL